MTQPPAEQPRQEDLVNQPTESKPTANPFAHAASISVSVPEAVEIRLVDATALADYEVWFLITSIIASALVGFGVAAVQAEGQPIRSTLVAIAVLCALIMLISLLMAFAKRRKLTGRAKKLRFRVGDQIDD